MIVIGLMGAIGCGKGTVADILVENYGFNSIATGDLAREEVAKRGLKPSRELTTKISSELLSKDPAFFLKKVVKKIKSDGWEKSVIDGIRNPFDVKFLKKAFPSIILVKVEVDPRIRFKRMKLRARPGFPKTYEKFLEHERLEMEKFNLKETWSNAKFSVDNNGSLKDLRKGVKKLMSKLL